MTQIDEIEQAVESLPMEDYRRFREWFLQHDWDAWDRQLAADSDSGKLDFLVDEVEEEKSQGRLRPL